MWSCMYFCTIIPYIYILQYKPLRHYHITFQPCNHTQSKQFFIKIN